MARMSFLVEINVPGAIEFLGVTPPDVQQYIEKAIAGWSGQFHSDDPLFHMNWRGNTKTTYLGKKERKTTR